MRQVKMLAALCLASLVAVSCGAMKPSKKQIPTVQFEQYGFKAGSTQSQKKSDIEISLTTIRATDIYTYPDLFSFNVDDFTQYPNDTRIMLKQLYPVGPDGKSWEFPFMSQDGKTNLLLCWVKLVNGTDHILRMKDARVYLILEGYEPLHAYDGLEGLYKAADAFEQDANQYLMTQHNKSFIKIGKALQLPDGFYRALIDQHRRSFKLINDVGKEILPGFTYEGLLVFPSIPEFPDTAKIAFYDVTTKTDAAGNPTEKTRFEYPLERQQVSMWYDEGAKQWRPGPPPVAAQ